MSLFDTTLQKISDRLFGEAKKKELIAMVISKEIAQTITPDQLIIRDGSVFISAPPTLKALIALRRDGIITALTNANLSIHTIA